MPARPWVGLSLMLEDDFLRAALPLFDTGQVETLEWSFDVGWSLPQLPEWTEALLEDYSRGGRLLGHGVTYSALSGAWTARQQSWLDRLHAEVQSRQYVHVSEHFGFMTAGDFHRSAPLAVPLAESSLRLGQQRLRQLQATGIAHVGLENLAFAFGRRDVEDQGRFLAELLAPVDGFLLLDLHNLYCQSCNFAVSIRELMESYPLPLVRELHVSGGSWSQGRGGGHSAGGLGIRRDTHDGPVPEEVFAAVELALTRCPHVVAVIFERLGGTLPAAADEAQFREDFQRLKTIVHTCRRD
jgi:uncharacterized protein (UPF0276 family)